jgi:transposase-like protein
VHRYRTAMVRSGRERLAGHVEVDETYLGGVEGGVFGRQTDTKAIVAIAVEVKHPKGFGRIRLQRVDDVSKHSLIPFIESAVEPGATVHTDGWQAYWTVGERGYEHERTIMRAQHDPAHVVMPGVHRVASLLKRWLLGTHQARSVPSTSTRTSTSSRSVSTDAARGDAACCSTGCSSKRSSPAQSPTEA